MATLKICGEYLPIPPLAAKSSPQASNYIMTFMVLVDYYGGYFITLMILTHSILDFSQDFVDPPVLPKDDLLYLQKELEEHLSKAENAAYSEENHHEELNGGDIAKDNKAFLESISSEQADSPTPSIEEHCLPPISPPEKSHTSVHEEGEEEFQEHNLPEIPHQELSISEFAPESYHEEGPLVEESQKEVSTFESFSEPYHEEIPAFEYSHQEVAPQQFESETHKELNEGRFEYFVQEKQEPNIESFESEKLEISEEEFGHEEHFEAHQKTFSPEEYKFEHQELQLEQPQGEPEYQESFEAQAHQESFESESQHFTHELPVEQPPNLIPLPELLHANEEIEQTDHILESPVGHMETPEDTGLIDNAHLNLVGGMDQFAAEKHEATPLHFAEGDGAGEATIGDFEQEVPLSSREHILEEDRHVANTFGVVISEHQLPPQQPVMKAAEPVIEETKPTFEEIKRDLEKKKLLMRVSIWGQVDGKKHTFTE
ncbi:hypothetical protein ACTXT7_003667 [Hymenolepis weldensis]